MNNNDLLTECTNLYNDYKQFMQFNELPDFLSMIGNDNMNDSLAITRHPDEMYSTFYLVL